MNTSFIKKIVPIALAMAFFFTPFPAQALTPTQVAKLVGDSFGFGWSVAVDGDTAVIGAPHDDDNGIGSGSAYVFIRSGGTWVQQAKLTAADAAAHDNFGVSVAVDGDTAVIGAPGGDDNGESSGSAYVFIRSGNTWTQQAKLTAADAATWYFFGWSVAVDGDTAVIGATHHQDNTRYFGSAYVFIRSGNTWTQQAKLTAADAVTGDVFGWSVAVDGDIAVIGLPYNDYIGRYSGSAYVFIRSGGTWVQQAKLTAADVTAWAFFGRSVAVDGDTAVIGSPYTKSAYVFSLTPSTPSDNDGDGVPDDQDNCPDTPNPDQGDWPDADGIGDVCDPDDDNDGVNDVDDNCPIDANSDQADSDYDTLGDACDVTFDTGTVVDALESECGSSVEVLTLTNPPGVNGMISKLTGNGSIVAKVAKAEEDYANGDIDTATYIDKLNGALDQLDDYDAQLTEKIASGKIEEPEASELQAYSANMRTMINNLISDATS